MRIDLTIQKQVSDGLFEAVGTCFSEETTAQYPCEVLVKEENGEVALYNDSNIKPSLMDGKEILMYVMDDPLMLEKALEVGDKIEFKGISLNLKLK
jgi:hypothetical protein